MNNPEWEEFGKVHHREKDVKISTRMLAVHMVLKMNMTHGEAADILIRCPEWVSKWMARFGEGGLDTLWDSPVPADHAPRRRTKPAE